MQIHDCRAVISAVISAFTLGNVGQRYLCFGTVSQYQNFSFSGCAAMGAHGANGWEAHKAAPKLCMAQHECYLIYSC